MTDAAALYTETHTNMAEAEYIAGFLETLHYTTEMCEVIEKSTRGQGSSNDWIEQRKGRITASIFHEVHTKVQTIISGRKRVVKVTPLTARIMGHQQSLDYLPSIQWGKIHERDAKDAFFKSEFGKHRKLRIREVGLFVKRDISYVGASPDAVCQCECCSATRK